MMKRWTCRLLLLVAALVMPIQGVAIAATFVQCHEQAAASIAADDHQHDDGTMHHHGSGEEGAPGSMASHHLCGHFVLHAPGMFSVGLHPQFTDWSAAAAPGYSPHFPEHPRRPPRG
jgi:hypothetical protein